MTIFLCIATALIPDVIIKIYDKIRERQLLDFFYKKDVLRNDLKKENSLKLKDKIKKNQVYNAKYKSTEF